ncbi:hypothetical protein Acsp03_38760 [Actinomadura sp. NBRC 104412]|nr:hypothetical protein Acsp03_38760 [Actinomadura sp. NBRC 104412]
MNGGVPPTARKARTGELTPPGTTRVALSNSRWETCWETCWETWNSVTGPVSQLQFGICS